MSTTSALMSGYSDSSGHLTSRNSAISFLSNLSTPDVEGTSGDSRSSSEYTISASLIGEESGIAMI